VLWTCHRYVILQDSLVYHKLTICVGNGIAIAWWRKTLQGATIKQLHRSWAFSSSIKDVALAGKYFNFIALAALTTKLTIIDSSLMQKAFSTYTGPEHPRNITHIEGFANETFPVTGVMNTRYRVPQILLKSLQDSVQTWSFYGGIYPYPSFMGCDGLCFLDVPAAGFEIDCTEMTNVTLDYGRETLENTTAIKFPDRPIFNIGFEASYNDITANDGNPYSYLTMNILSTQINDDAANPGTCPGFLTNQTCRLRPALVSYPVAIYNYDGVHAQNGFSLAIPTWDDPKKTNLVSAVQPNYMREAKQQEGFKILLYTDVHESVDTWPSTQIGGLQLAFQNYLGGVSELQWTYIDQFSATYNGSAAQHGQNYDVLNASQCSYTFDDGASLLLDTVTSINEIMFINAMNNIGWTQAQIDDPNYYGPSNTFNGTQFSDTVHYSTNIWYMIGAVISTFLCVLCVLPTYWGYWQLGRPVALSPFEIAAAFRSPMVDTSGTIKDIIKERGDQDVKYGLIARGDAAGRLGVAEPQYVERAHPAIGSAKREINEKFGGVFRKKPTN
jgi:hypothetical protein